MPKVKPNRSAKKRFKVTGSGKLKRSHAYMRHILTKKSKSRKTKLSKSGLVHESDAPRIKRILGIG